MQNYFDELNNINSINNHQLFFHINEGPDDSYECINNNIYQFKNSKKNIEIITYTLNAL